MGLSGQILDNRDEVYFTEYAYYYTLKNEGVLGDISEAVTKPLEEYGESRSIKDKMSRDQQAYYGVGEGDEAKYYAVPHYAGYSGLIYNIDLFEEEGYYFAKTPSDNTREGRFIDKFNTVRSAGPDGEFGTSDDGLPPPTRNSSSCATLSPTTVRLPSSGTAPIIRTISTISRRRSSPTTRAWIR